MRYIKCLLSISLLINTLHIKAQDNEKIYIDSLKSFRANYIQSHEVVKENDRKFLHFFPIDMSYDIVCDFEKTNNNNWFQMNTSGKVKQVYRKYGKLTFTIHDTTLHLYVYQSQSLMSNQTYKDYLFIPFIDLTSGQESYGAGRYLECFTSDIRDNKLNLDFNKAYNPYCAYADGYNCPIPPRENDLSVAIKAGEKNYGKAH